MPKENSELSAQQAMELPIAADGSGPKCRNDLEAIKLEAIDARQEAK